MFCWCKYSSDVLNCVSCCLKGDEVEIVVECHGSRHGHQAPTLRGGRAPVAPSGDDDSNDDERLLLGGRGLHGLPDRGCGMPLAFADAISCQYVRRPVVKFRKIEGHAASAAAQPGGWHRLQLAANGERDGDGNGSGHGTLSLRFFAELGNGATAELLAGE